MVGSAWHRHYDRLHLHTVKEMSHLPHLSFPDQYPKYVPRALFCDYLQQYADTFDLHPHFGAEVTDVSRTDDERWRVRVADGREWNAEHMVVATGVNRVAHQPTFEGQERFGGRWLHSRDYKNARPYRGERVLIVGMGNTGAEIALDMAENGAEAFLSVRSPVNIVPRDFLGRPTQKTALLLSRLPQRLGDAIGNIVRNLTMGDLRNHGLPLSSLSPARQLREQGKTPVVDVGTAQQIRLKKVKILPAIRSIFENGAVFVNGRRYTFDAIILATGYRARVQDFLPETDGLLDEYEVPNCCIGEGRYQNLYFLGFDNYSPGGILGAIYRDSQLIAEHLADAFGGAASPQLQDEQNAGR